MTDEKFLELLTDDVRHYLGDHALLNELPGLPAQRKDDLYNLIAGLEATIKGYSEEKRATIQRSILEFMNPDAVTH